MYLLFYYHAVRYINVFSFFFRMVASAVLGAAAGTGMALVVAMTIVVYRYYTLRRRAKEWGPLDRYTSDIPPRKTTKPVYAITQKVRPYPSSNLD